MYRAFRILVVTILAGTLLVGRCLPCRDLYAKVTTTTKSCCDKSGACNRLPTPKSRTTPCPFQQNVVAAEKVDPQAAKLQLITESQLAPLVAFVISIPPPSAVKPEILSPEYSPPLLYVLHERFLI